MKVIPLLFSTILATSCFAGKFIEDSITEQLDSLYRSKYTMKNTEQYQERITFLEKKISESNLPKDKIRDKFLEADKGRKSWVIHGTPLETISTLYSNFIKKWTEEEKK